jgi:hypothetical protein
LFFMVFPPLLFYDGLLPRLAMTGIPITDSISPRTSSSR